jgi:hypothetical protein
MYTGRLAKKIPRVRMTSTSHPPRASRSQRPGKWTSLGPKLLEVDVTATCSRVIRDLLERSQQSLALTPFFIAQQS